MLSAGSSPGELRDDSLLQLVGEGAMGEVSPLTDSLGLLHGGSCCQDVLGFKGHHGLHLQDGGIGQSVVHAVFGSVVRQDLFSVTLSACPENGKRKI